MSDTESNSSERFGPKDLSLNDHRSHLVLATPIVPPNSHPRNRRNSMAVADSDSDSDSNHDHTLRQAPRASIQAGAPQGLRRTTSPSTTRETEREGILRPRTHSISEHLKSLIGIDLEKKTTRHEDLSPGGVRNQNRRPLMVSIDLDADSHASTSQETEEDVCFPMTKEHVLVNGIDFERIDDFVREEREQQITYHKSPEFRVNTQPLSPALAKPNKSAASKFARYTRFFQKPEGEDSTPLSETHGSSSQFHEKLECTSVSLQQIKFGGAKITEDYVARSPDGYAQPADLPTRFSFFSTANEGTIHAPDIPTLIGDGTASQVFNGGEPTWWLDCACPTDSEVKMLAKAFGLHPLTTEDIRMQETREKVELFKNYYFVSFHTFDPDQDSEEFLDPVNFYIVVLGNGVLTFHFLPLVHSANVRRRVRQLRSHFEVNSDWLCYALIDNITDSFAPIITNIEYEADAIEDYVFVEEEPNYRLMLQRIGESRRKVMTLMRLLSGKADVIKMFAKRCLDEAAMNLIHSSHHLRDNASAIYHPRGGPNAGSDSAQGPPPTNAHADMLIAQPRADIAMYLGDIQDHLVTMFQNLRAYEKILSRSHANYLAQLQCTAVSSNNKITIMLSNVTIVGTMFLPLNFITGMFGMNVPVPGGDGGNDFRWFFGIVGVMVAFVLLVLIIGRIWVARSEKQPELENKLSMRKFKFRKSRNDGAKSVLSSNTKYE